MATKAKRNAAAYADAPQFATTCAPRHDRTHGSLTRLCLALLLPGMILALVTFWLFVQTMLNGAPDRRHRPMMTIRHTFAGRA